MARGAEQRGYSTLAVTDHLDLSGAHVARLSWLPALASAAAVTSTLRLTTMVANQDLRHPAVLAREIASLDVLSGGRFEFGLGAGWNPVEYAWAGLTLDPAPVRIRRLAEYVTIVRALLDPRDPSPVTFAGEFFTITDMPRVPASRQDPLPLMLGGALRTMLSLAAREADIVNLLTLRDQGTTDEILGEKTAWLTQAAPHRHRELALSIVLVATDADEPVTAVEAALPRSAFARHVAQSQTIDQIAAAPHVLAGSPARIIDDLHRRREMWGVSYVLVPADAMDSLQPVIDELAGT